MNKNPSKNLLVFCYTKVRNYIKQTNTLIYIYARAHTLIIIFHSQTEYHLSFTRNQHSLPHSTTNHFARLDSAGLLTTAQRNDPVVSQPTNPLQPTNKHHSSSFFQPTFQDTGRLLPCISGHDPETPFSL